MPMNRCWPVPARMRRPLFPRIAVTMSSENCRFIVILTLPAHILEVHGLSAMVKLLLNRFLLLFAIQSMA